MATPGLGFDILALGKLAWNLYKSAKNAGDDFKMIAEDVNLLEASLRELYEQTRTPNSLFKRSTYSQRRGLEEFMTSCTLDLHGLSKLMGKYRSLTSPNPNLLDRVTLTPSRQADIRGTLKRQTDNLNHLLLRVHTSSLEHIEEAGEKTNLKLNEIQNEIRLRLATIHRDVLAGRKPPNLLTDMENFDALENELIDDTITEFDVEENKNDIYRWLAELQDASVDGEADQEGNNDEEDRHEKEEKHSSLDTGGLQGRKDTIGTSSKLTDEEDKKPCIQPEIETRPQRDDYHGNCDNLTSNQNTIPVGNNMERPAMSPQEAESVAEERFKNFHTMRPKENGAPPNVTDMLDDVDNNKGEESIARSNSRNVNLSGYTSGWFPCPPSLPTPPPPPPYMSSPLPNFSSNKHRRKSRHKSMFMQRLRESIKAEATRNVPSSTNRRHPLRETPTSLKVPLRSLTQESSLPRWRSNPPPPPIISSSEPPPASDPRLENIDTYQLLTIEIPPDHREAVLEKHLRVPLDLLYHGIVGEDVIVTRTRYEETTGRPVIQKKLARLQIERGTPTGSRVYLNNWNESPHIALIIVDQEIPGTSMRRVGDDIHYDIRLTLQEAISGWNRTLPIFDSTYELSATGSTGRSHSYSSRGMPKYRQPGQFGRLIVNTVIEFPVSLQLNEMQKTELTRMHSQARGNAQIRQIATNRSEASANHGIRK